MKKGIEIPNLGGDLYMNGTLFNLNGSTINVTGTGQYLYALSGLIEDLKIGVGL